MINASLVLATFFHPLLHHNGAGRCADAVVVVLIDAKQNDVTDIHLAELVLDGRLGPPNIPDLHRWEQALIVVNNALLYFHTS